MATSLPGVIPVPLMLLLVLVGVLGLLFLYSIGLTAFAVQIPHVISQLICQIKRRPMVMMHYVNRKVELFAPSRHGDKGQKNTLTLPEAVGAKFDASGAGYEEIYGKSILYHYYSKASFPASPTDVAAINNFYKYMGKIGVKANAELIDVLFVEENDITDIYTRPFQDAILKALPVPLQTDKEYLLNESRLKQEKLYLESRIKDISDDFKRNQELDPDYEMNIDTFNEYNDSKARYDVCISQWNEMLELKSKRDKLRKIVNEIEELKEDKKELLWDIDSTLGYIDEDTKKQIYSLERIRNELNEKVIEDGLFVYPKIHDMIFAASSLNSSGMNEAVSIANADAYNQNIADKSGWDLKTMSMIVFFLIALLFGGGIAYKAAFG